MWTATEPGSRRLSSYRRTSADDYIARIEALLAIGEGYSEVHHVGQQYPLLALQFKDGYGVVHQFSAEDKVFLLAGYGVIGARETVRVPLLDDVDYAVFSGEFVLSSGHAWEVVKDFLRHGAVEGLGEWQELLTAAGLGDGVASPPVVADAGLVLAFSAPAGPGPGVAGTGGCCRVILARRRRISASV